MAIRLEVFESGREDQRPEVLVTDRSHFDEVKLASFEEGYSAGWEDAVAARNEEEARLQADLARHLQALSFTYHEAREHVLKALEPLLSEMTGRLLPAVARAALGPLVAETLRPLAAEAAAAPLTLVTGPASRPVVEAVLAAEGGLPVTVVEESSLGEGQVYLRFGASETRIDLDRAVSQIAGAVRDFFSLTGKEPKDG